MTPAAFIAKWKAVNLSERAACQSHFLDLCELLGQPKPTDVDPDGTWYTFEKGVSKDTGGQGFADVADPDARGIGTVKYPRTVPKDAASAANLKKRTLTNLYNDRPTWLKDAHRRLDDAVFAAYGWPPSLSDDDLLARLLALNLSRAAAGIPAPAEEADE